MRRVLFFSLFFGLGFIIERKNIGMLYLRRSCLSGCRTILSVSLFFFLVSAYEVVEVFSALTKFAF